MKTTEYKGFTIRHFQPTPTGKNSYRIYQNEEYKQTSSSLKNAKRLIDFNISKGVWNV